MAEAADTALRVWVQTASLDSVAGYRIGLVGGVCGYAEAFVRQRDAEPPEFLPLPPGFVEGLTTYRFDPAGNHIVFVEFDGQNGAFAVVRSVPGYRTTARSARIGVPSGDATCGFAQFESASEWTVLVCTEGEDPHRYTRVRGNLTTGRIVLDTAVMLPPSAP